LTTNNLSQEKQILKFLQKKTLPSNFLHPTLVMCCFFNEFFHQQQKNISAWGQMGFRCHPSPLTTPSSNAWSPPCRSAWNEARFDGDGWDFSTGGETNSGGEFFWGRKYLRIV